MMSADPVTSERRVSSRVEGPDLNRRVALNVKEAAFALGVSERHLRSILPEIPTVRLGARTLIPIDALRNWLTCRADRGEKSVSRMAEDILASLE